MNWDAIGAVAESIGAIGVIGSLFYLSSQIRENSRHLKAGAFNTVTEASASITLSFLHDSELSHIVMKALRDERLESAELERFGFALHVMFRRWEGFQNQMAEGLLSASLISGFEKNALRFINTTAGRRWWSANREVFNDDFRRYVAEMSAGEVG